MRRIWIIALTFLLSASLMSSVFAHGKDTHRTDGVSKAQTMMDAKKKYHQDISIIRKMHPNLLLHKRDQTLRQGVRTEESSLKACIQCHAGKSSTTAEYVPVNQTGQFCSTCHQKVAVSLDCFSCHRTTPE